MSNRSCCLVFIVSAPSGTGKTTVAERLVKRVDHLKLSRSYTSRTPRADEADGVDYNFVSRSRFEEMAANGEFLEFADVFGNLYGTHAGDTTRCLESGDDVMLVIDVQGARTVRAAGVPHVAIFVLPPSFEVLERRLRGRSKDTDDAIGRRLQVAREEISSFEQYDYLVINDELEACVERIKSIVLAERARLGCMRTQALEILRTFSRDKPWP
jgi:guanylate kinase